MRLLIERYARRLIRRGISDGLLGGSGLWIAVGMAAWLVRFVSRPAPGRIIREKIAVGEALVISSVAAPPIGRKARKLPKPDRAEAKAVHKQVGKERKRAVELPDPVLQAAEAEAAAEKR